MNSLLFDHDLMAKHYNCSGRTLAEWQALGKPNVIIGFVYAVLSVFYLTLLLPFMVVFVKSGLMKFSCYKIMFFVGIVDVIVLPIAGFYAGYASAIGMVYCMSPVVNYVMGNVALSCWYAGSAACMLLALNRCIDLISPYVGQKLFGGNKTFCWLLIPTGYFLYFWIFSTTTVFNSNYYAFFFDPFVGTPERHGLFDSEHYPHYFHSIHNTMVIVVLFSAYLSLLIRLWLKTSGIRKNVKTSKFQRQTFVQSTLICSGTFISAAIYAYMQFLPTPVWLVVVAEIAWQSSHGAAGMSYAFLNPSMRRAFFKLYCSKYVSPVSAVYKTTSKSEHQINLKY